MPWEWTLVIRWTSLIEWTPVVAALAIMFIMQLWRLRTIARTRHLANEMALRRESEVRFRQFIEQSSDAIVLFDSATGTFIFANSSSERIFGVPRERIIGAHPIDFSPPRQPDGESSATAVDRYVTSALTGTDQVFSWLHRHPDGTEVSCEVHMTTIPYAGGIIIRCSMFDFTERQSYEARLRRNDTLTSLGLMTGGVAHDFNNILAGIGGFADFLKMEVTSSRGRARVAAIAQAVDRARELTARLIAFAQQRDITPEIYDVHACIHAAIGLFYAARPVGVSVRLDLIASKVWVNGYPTLLQNAILNLCFNARDAMPTGGQILVADGIEVITANHVPSNASCQLNPGTYLHLTIADAGTGMSPAVLARCLEPLFSTKGAHGTGLGLPGVDICTREHRGDGGRVWAAQSTPSEGRVRQPPSPDGPASTPGRAARSGG